MACLALYNGSAGNGFMDVSSWYRELFEGRVSGTGIFVTEPSSKLATNEEPSGVNARPVMLFLRTILFPSLGSWTASFASN